MKYLPFLLVLVIACKNVNHNPNIKNDTLPSPDSTQLKVEKQSNRGGIHFDSLLTRQEIEQLKDSYDVHYWRNKADYYPAYDYFIKLRSQLKKYNSLADSLGLPNTARIVEYKSLKRLGYYRALILWIDEPYINFEDDELGCGSITWGIGYFSGDVYFSLIDIEKNKIINTVEVITEYGLPIPFLFSSGNNIGTGAYYTSKPLGYKGLKKVEVLSLYDMNGDGKPLEFCLYEQQGCAWTTKTMYAYNRETDSLYNYRINVTTYEYDSLGKLDTVYNPQSNWVYIDFEYPYFKPKKFALSRTMIRGAGLPVYSVSFDKNNKEITGEMHYYDERYVLKHPEIFEKY